MSGLKTLLSDIEVGPSVGAGTFGIVYKGRWKGTSVAIKIISHQGAGHSSNARTSREAMIGMASSHPNVVAVYRVVTAANEVVALEVVAVDGYNLKTYIIMEYCDKGNLESHREEGWALMRSDYQKGLVWVLRCLLEIVFGMEYLHSLSIVHGDLKCANVLCKSSTSDARGFTCKVADFGLSQTGVTDGVTAITSKPGTAVFAAPELLRTDLEDIQVTYQVLEKDWRPEFPEQTPELYKEVVSQCWATEREDRPSFKDVRGSLTDMLNQEFATRRKSLPSQRSRSAEVVDMRALLGTNEPAPRVHPHSG
ncbi:hypothetical protein WJX75_002257 [Coccomyxa subellipsoidea]|uniref:Protein kinase domain-containing protein n=1 Tax=Coccomyxa subellipsoidea TaxID=248742 RepID=A0ABR2Z2R7_9CHLO